MRKTQTLTCSKGLLVLIPFPPQKTQLSRKPRLVMDVLPSSPMSRRASSVSLKERTRHKHGALHFLNTYP